MNNKMNFLDAAKSALEKYYPGYICAFVAGSVVRGEATATSDIDIVVLFADDFDKPQRHSVIDFDWPIEFFVHNQKSLDYFFTQDRKDGVCSLMTMVVDGIALPEETDTTRDIKRKAAVLIEAGPPVLTQDDIENRLYFLTDRLDDLDVGRTKLETYGILARLYHDLGDLYLRAHNQWSGQGKAFAKILCKYHPVLAQEYENAFSDAYTGRFDRLINLADKIQQDFGGRYWAGHKRIAPDDWKGKAS